MNDSSLSAKYTGGASGGQGATAALFVPGGLVFFVTGATGADAAGSRSQQGSGGSTSLTAADAQSTATPTPLVYQPGSGDGPGAVDDATEAAKNAGTAAAKGTNDVVAEAMPGLAPNSLAPIAPPTNRRGLRALMEQPPAEWSTLMLITISRGHFEIGSLSVGLT